MIPIWRGLFIYMDVMYAAGAGRARAAIYMDVMYAAGAGRARAAICLEHKSLPPSMAVVYREMT